MKKTLAVILALVLALALFAGCGQPGGGDPAPLDVDSLQTVGDAFALVETQKVQETETATYEDTFVYAFKLGDDMYRVVASVPADVSAALNELSFSDPDYNVKFAELLSPLTIDSCENLTDLIPAQEELDKLIGRTGRDLLDDGWYVCFYEYGKPECSMNHGVFTYKVVFDDALPAGNDDVDEAIAPLTVRSVTYDGVGDATYLEYKATPALEKTMSAEEARQEVETAMLDLIAESYGDKVADCRIDEVTIYSDEEMGSELCQLLQLGPDAYAFDVRYALLPAEGADPIELAIANGEIDETTGWVVDKTSVGVLRPNEAGSDPAYVITDFGTGW